MRRMWSTGGVTGSTMTSSKMQRQGQLALFLMTITGTAPLLTARQMPRHCSGGRNLQTTVASSLMRHLRFQNWNKKLKLIMLISFIQEHRGDWKCHLANTDLKVRVNKTNFAFLFANIRIKRYLTRRSSLFWSEFPLLWISQWRETWNT